MGQWDPGMQQVETDFLNRSRYNLGHVAEGAGERSCQNLSIILGSRHPGHAREISKILLGHANRFVSLPISQLDKETDRLLQNLLSISGAERVRLFLMDPELNRLFVAREAWDQSLSITSDTPELINEPNWFFTQARECGVVYLNTDDTWRSKEDQRQVQRCLTALEATCFLGVPVYYEKQPRGLLALSRSSSVTPWSLDDLEALQGAAEVIYHVWLRKISQAHEPIRQEALECATERWSSFLKFSPDTITLLDPEGRIADINRTLLLPKEELLGKPLSQFLPQEEHSAIESRLRQVFEGEESLIYESHMRTNDGGTQWFCNRLSPLFKNGEVVNALLISTDITYEKEHASPPAATQASSNSPQPFQN